MKIAVSIPAPGSELEEYAFEILSSITREHLSHKFLFLFEQKIDQKFIVSKNITPLVFKPVPKTALLYKLKYDLPLTRLLKKHAADVFVSFNGVSCLGSSISQRLVIGKGWLQSYPAVLKRYARAFLGKTIAPIVTCSNAQLLLEEKFGLEYHQQDEIHLAASSLFKPLDFETRERIRGEHTSGREFFYSNVGALQSGADILGLLKAFSIFKKRQKSNWKLVLAGTGNHKFKTFAKELPSYKYREDVVLLEHTDQQSIATIASAAYAGIIPRSNEQEVLNFFRAGVPVLTELKQFSVAGEAAVYCTFNDINQVADKMMLLYKDERLRSQLIMSGHNVEKQFSWTNSAQKFWELLSATQSAKPAHNLPE